MKRLSQSEVEKLRKQILNDKLSASYISGTIESVHINPNTLKKTKESKKTTLIVVFDQYDNQGFAVEDDDGNLHKLDDNESIVRVDLYKNLKPITTDINTRPDYFLDGKIKHNPHLSSFTIEEYLKKHNIPQVANPENMKDAILRGRGMEGFQKQLEMKELYRESNLFEDYGFSGKFIDSVHFARLGNINPETLREKWENNGVPKNIGELFPFISLFTKGINHVDFLLNPTKYRQEIEEEQRLNSLKQKFRDLKLPYKSGFRIRGETIDEANQALEDPLFVQLLKDRKSLIYFTDINHSHIDSLRVILNEYNLLKLGISIENPVEEEESIKIPIGKNTITIEPEVKLEYPEFETIDGDTELSVSVNAKLGEQQDITLSFIIKKPEDFELRYGLDDGIKYILEENKKENNAIFKLAIMEFLKENPEIVEQLKIKKVKTPKPR